MQSQLSAESFSAWNAVSFLTSDPTLRDALYQCDTMTASVQVLGRRGLPLEVAVQCCLACCDLMYNPFPIPDERFVKQFIAAHGPEAVLDRLDNRGAEHVHGTDSKEVGHLQNHVQAQLQTRQQQLDFNTAFILLPIMAMAETPLGRSWFAEATNQQRLAAHLRRLTSYRELLQLVNLVQQEVCTRERFKLDCVAKLDRVAIVERFVAFFKTLESKDHEEKVRELLELEEREKSRKEKKRVKKRQQRLKQKMKTRTGEAPDDPAAKDGVVGSDVTKTKSQPLDALDEIPLTVGPDGVQDVPDPPAASLPPGGAQEPPGNEDEWVMVGGKRCYQARVRTALALSCPEVTRDADPLRPLGEEHRSAVAHTESKPSSLSDEAFDPTLSPNAAQAGFLDDYNVLDSGGLRRQTPPSESGARANKGSMRWADIARNGNTYIQPEESGIMSPLQNVQPCSEVKVTRKGKETYHEQFPSLAQQTSADELSEQQQQTASNDAQAGSQTFDIVGATHQFLEELCNSSGFAERAPRATGCAGQSATSQAPSSARLDPNILYEALTGWMWQAAVAQGLVTPDSDPPLGFPPVDILSPLTSQLLKPRATAGKQQASANENQAGAIGSASRSASFTSVGGVSNTQQPTQTVKNESNIFGAQPPSAAAGQGSTSIKDWFDMTSADIDHFFAHQRQQSASLEATERGPRLDNQRGNPTACLGHTATNSASTRTLPPNSQNSTESAACTEAKTTGVEAGAGVGRGAEDPLLWAGSGFTDWLSSFSSSVVPGGSSSSSRVSGKPVLDSNDLYGLPLPSNLENPRTQEFPVHRHVDQISAQRTNSQRDCLDSASASQQKHPGGFEERTKDEKPLNAAAEHFNMFFVSGSMPPREGFGERDDYPWFYQESARPKIKTATVSVPRSSDSESTTQSSSAEQRSEAIPDDAFSLTPDTSRSSCVNNYDSFHQLSPSNSTASSFTGLHECLAPGFLRAAAGDVHMRSLWMGEEDNPEPEEAASSIFRPVVGNMGLLPAPNQAADGGLQRSIDRQYPDLSTVPERDQSLVFPTSLPKASRVVGQGRPRRSVSGETDSNQASHVSGFSVSFLDVTSTAGDSAGAGRGTTTRGNVSTSSEQMFARPPPTPAERPESPEVLFPESLREDDAASERSKPVDVFPSIHDMNERDLFQDVFSNSFFLEQIAIDQIRRRFRAMGGGEEVLRNQSILFHDLDYYASLYGVRLRDILGPLMEAKAPRTERVVTKKNLDQTVPGWKALVKELGRKMNSKEDLTESGGDLDLPCDSEDPAISDWPWSCKVRLHVCGTFTEMLCVW